jgi:lipopolysaccharide export system permease protein
MDTTIHVQPKEFYITANDTPQLTNTELRSYIHKQKARGIGNVQAFEDEYYRRYSTAISVLIMTLIGVSLSSRKVRGGMGLNLGVGLALSSLYILFTTMSTTFSVNGVMPTLLSVWLPNITFFIIGIILYFKAPK